MGTTLINMPVIPFQKEGLSILPEIERRITNCRECQSFEWVDIYQKCLGEVRDYVSTGRVPSDGFSQGIMSFGDTFLHPLREAVAFFEPMPVGSIEAFYAICTSSPHVREIPSKVGRNDSWSGFNGDTLPDKLYTNPGYIESVHYRRFGSYGVERGLKPDRPFEFNRTDHGVHVVSFESELDDVSEDLTSKILDAYTDLPVDLHRGYSKNVPLDVFVLDIPDRYKDKRNAVDFVRGCVGSVQADLEGYILPDGRRLNVREVIWGKSNNEWYIPNCRMTISDSAGLVECYLIMQFIPLPSFIEMIAQRARRLHRLLTLIPQRFIPVPLNFHLLLLQDLVRVSGYQSSQRFTAGDLELDKYEQFFSYTSLYGKSWGGIKYHPNVDWSVVPKHVYEAVYQLLETFNHHRSLPEHQLFAAGRGPRLPEPETLQGHIFRSLYSFGRDNSNYLELKEGDVTGVTKKKVFKHETKITQKLVTYLDNRVEYIVHRESDEGGGRLDIKVEFRESGLPSLMIEVKLIRALEGGGMPSDSSLEKTFRSAVHQLLEYMNHGDTKGMLLFFTLDLNEGQVARRLEECLSGEEFKFVKIPKPSNKITHQVEVDELVLPVRFMKLSSVSPSKK